MRPRSGSPLVGMVGAAALAAMAALGGCSRPAPAATPPPLHGAVGVSLGSQVHDDPPADVERELDLVVELGGTWVRVDLDWSAIEPTRGSYDWSVPDRLIDAARARGLAVLALPNATARWARPPGAPWNHPPTDPADFASFVAAACQRYGDRVAAWEVWNEPNSAAFWAPRPDPAAYTRLLAAASAAIRAGDPGDPVLTGGTAPGPDSPTGLHLSPVTFLRGVYDAGGGPWFDAAATHPYTYPDRPDPGVADSGFGEVVRMQQVMAARGDGDRLVWLTEYGAPTGTSADSVSEAAQAELLVAGIDVARTLPGTGPLFVYSTRDRGPDPAQREQNFGLVTEGFDEKPAWAAVRDAVAASPG